jgi:hypothetical protein
MQRNRFFMTFFTALILYQMTANRILNCSILLFIGNISYSVYLIHWPLLEWYKYSNPALFVFSNEISISGNFDSQLIKRDLFRWNSTPFELHNCWLLLRKHFQFFEPKISRMETANFYHCFTIFLDICDDLSIKEGFR